MPNLLLCCYTDDLLTLQISVCKYLVNAELLDQHLITILINILHGHKNKDHTEGVPLNRKCPEKPQSLKIFQLLTETEAISWRAEQHWASYAATVTPCESLLEHHR